MTLEKITLFDTTLRDGQQTPGLDFSVEDKIAISKLLDDFGIDYVEGGYPGANPTDTAFFAEKRTHAANAAGRQSVRRRRRGGRRHHDVCIIADSRDGGHPPPFFRQRPTPSFRTSFPRQLALCG